MSKWLGVWLLLICAMAAPARAVDLSLGAIVLEPPSGFPEQKERMFMNRAQTEIAQVGFEPASQGATAAFRLSGTATAKNTPDGAAVTVLWTLVDPRGGSRQVEVSDLAPYKAGNPWDAVDVGTLQRLAETTAYALESLETGSKMPDKARIPATPTGPAAAAKTPTTATRVHLAAIEGAPGDGEAVLARALAEFLVHFDVVLVPTAEPGAYVIGAKVSVAKASDTLDRVQILWTVKNRKGSVLAKVSQDNTVTAGSLSPHWGQTAVYASEAAADGLLSALGQLGPQAPDSGAKAKAVKRKKR